MPCKKCKDNKYKYGNTGECKYATKEECEKANPKKYNKMKKYPSPIGKKTYEEYAKELKEFNLTKVEKVELGIVDDIKKLFSQYINLNESLDKEYALISKAANGLGGWLKKMDKITKNADTLYKEADKAINELGINRNTFRWYDDLDKIRDDKTRLNVKEVVRTLNSI